MDKGIRNKEIVLDTSLGTQPKFISLEFHLRFFPKVLRRWLLRYRRKSQEYQSPFSNHMPVEFILVFFVCIVLIALGVPGLINNRSLLSGAMTFVGLAGIIAMFVSSIRTENRNRAEIGGRYSFDYIVEGVFLFFVVLGGSAGISVGFLKNSLGLMIFYGILGILAGYVVGILAGIWINYLGWIARFLMYLLNFLMFFLVLLDIILICFFAFAKH